MHAAKCQQSRATPGHRPITWERLAGQGSRQWSPLWWFSGCTFTGSLPTAALHHLHAAAALPHRCICIAALPHQRTWPAALPHQRSCAENVVKECQEEASIPAELAAQAKPAGAVSYTSLQAMRAGGPASEQKHLAHVCGFYSQQVAL